MIGFNAPIDMVETLDRISLKRWGKIDRTLLLYEAVSQYIEREENPNKIYDDIRDAFKKNPGLVAEAVTLYEAKKSSKK